MEKNVFIFLLGNHLRRHAALTPLMPHFIPVPSSCSPGCSLLKQRIVDRTEEEMYIFWHTYLLFTQIEEAEGSVCKPQELKGMREAGLNREKDHSLVRVSTTTGGARREREKATRDLQSSWFVRFWSLSVFRAVCLYLYLCPCASLSMSLKIHRLTSGVLLWLYSFFLPFFFFLFLAHLVAWCTCLSTEKSQRGRMRKSGKWVSEWGWARLSDERQTEKDFSLLAQCIFIFHSEFTMFNSIEWTRKKGANKLSTSALIFDQWREFFYPCQLFVKPEMT